MIYIPMKVRHEVKALAAGRIFEFYITDDIKPDGERFNWDTYSWEAVESTTCQRYFVDNTKDAQAGDTINLYINSWGGSVKEALPKLKLPHISITGEWGFNPPRVPTFGISWYKYGGILQGARIIGSLGDKYIGAGEAGPEAVLPLYSFYSELRNIITELVDRNAGPTEFNQYNSYYSPKDLSPAECARKTRDETRQLLKNVKRA